MLQGGHELTSCNLLIRSVNFAEIEPLQKEGRWDQDQISQKAQRPVRIGNIDVRYIPEMNGIGLSGQTLIFQYQGSGHHNVAYKFNKKPRAGAAKHDS